MNEHLLTSVLIDEERLAPDPADVMAGLTHGIRRRRQRRLAGGAAALALVVAGSFAVVNAWPDAQAPGESSAAAPATVFHRKIRFGWLPDGLERPVFQAGLAGESVNYGLSEDRYLRAEISNLQWQPNLDQAGWQRVQVAGRPGRLVSKPTRTIVDWQLPSGRWATIEVGRGRPGMANAQPGLQADAERIAAGITDGDPEPVRVSFEARVLPKGTKIVNVSEQENGYGTIELSTGDPKVAATWKGTTEDGITSDRPVTDQESNRVTVTVSPDTVKPSTDMYELGKVNGRRIWRTGALGVVVDFSPHGQILVQTSNTLPLTTEELRAVAEGVRWNG